MDRWERPGSRQVNDVQPGVELLRHTKEQLNRLQLRFVRPGRKIGCITPPVSRCLRGVDSRRRPVDWPSHLRVGQQRQSGSAEHRQRLAQLRFVHPRKAVDSRMHEEALEARNASLNQPRNLSLVAAYAAISHYAAPAHPIHPGVADAFAVQTCLISRCSRPLGFQRGHRDRLRLAVQWHIDQRRHPASRGGLGRGLESLPVSAARSLI